MKRRWVSSSFTVVAVVIALIFGCSEPGETPDTALEILPISEGAPESMNSSCIGNMSITQVNPTTIRIQATFNDHNYGTKQFPTDFDGYPEWNPGNNIKASNRDIPCVLPGSLGQYLVYGTNYCHFKILSADGDTMFFNSQITPTTASGTIIMYIPVGIDLTPSSIGFDASSDFTGITTSGYWPYSNYYRLVADRSYTFQITEQIDAKGITYGPEVIKHCQQYRIGSALSWSVTVNSSIGGTTNPSPGSYSIPACSSFAVTAVPNQGYSFSGWTGSLTSSNNPLIIFPTDNMSLTATFQPSGPPPLNVTIIGPSCVLSKGSNVTLTASPTGGSGTYTYLWSPGGWTTQTITRPVGSCPTNFSVTVTSGTQTASATKGVGYMNPSGCQMCMDE